MTAAALQTHYVAVADSSPVPVLLYNFAAAFGVNLPTETIAALAAHPNVKGLKESGGDVSQVADQVVRTPVSFPVVVGAAPALYASLCVGASGAVVAAANVIPELLIDLYTAASRGDQARALMLQRAVTPLARAVTTGGGVPALKAAMNLAGYQGGWPRAPLMPASDATVDALRRMLAELPTSSARGTS
jgi:4-hydroxy-2-oxoglutarate aldolase